MIKFALSFIDDSTLEQDKKHLFENYYKQHDDDLETKQFKLLFNFYIKQDLREKILDEIVKHFCDDEEIYEKLYLSFDELKAMHQANMIIGSHSHSHCNFLKISKIQEEAELYNSFQKLGEFCQKIKIFSYPYGEFSPHSKELLSKYQCDFAFTSLANSKDLDVKDFKENFYTLARYDCNEFKFGKANKG